MKYALCFVLVLLVVSLVNSLGSLSFDQSRATGISAVRYMAMENIAESVKLYAVGLLIIKLLKP